MWPRDKHRALKLKKGTLPYQKSIRLGDPQKSCQCLFWETSCIVQSVFSSVLSPFTVLYQSIHFFLLPQKESHPSLLLRTMTNWEQKRNVKMPFTKLQQQLAVHPVTLSLWLTTLKTIAYATQKQSAWPSTSFTTRCWRLRGLWRSWNRNRETKKRMRWCVRLKELMSADMLRRTPRKVISKLYFLRIICHSTISHLSLAPVQENNLIPGCVLEFWVVKVC